MSRSFHQTRKRHQGGSFSFVFDGDKKWMVKNKHKDLQDTETIGKRKVKWKKKKHLAYGEQRNFRMNGKPMYTGEVYIKDLGYICFTCIEKWKERKKNKLSVYENFEED